MSTREYRTSPPEARRACCEADARQFWTRRQWLQQPGGGLGGIALTALLLQEDGLAAEGLHFPARARRVIQLFMAGGASHVDTFDYKPQLIQDHGKPWDPGEKVELFQSQPGVTLAGPWQWKQYGESGHWLSDIVAPLAPCVDRIAFLHAMVSTSAVHSQATLLQTTGFPTPGFPGAGAWVSYALGSETDELPTFVVLPDHRGLASNGAKNWSAGFLPARHQGTVLWASGREPMYALELPQESGLSPQADRQGRTLLQQLNRRHLARHPGDSRLEARIRAYELAGQMQLSVPSVMDLSDEPSYILKMYGVDQENQTFPKEINEAEETVYFGKKCLIARRLLERGVRFVQIWSGCDNAFPRRNWDSHEDIARDHRPLALAMARRAAALIRDLQQRGMLEDTVIHWTTEFGRMPCAQGSKGRDHNPFVFTNWLAGGGIRGGVICGQSDQWGYKPLEPQQATTCHDVYATLLHVLGIDHKRLTVRHNGIDRRLTDVHGRVLHEVLV